MRNILFNLKKNYTCKINTKLFFPQIQSITLSFFLATPYSSGSGTHLATPTRVGVVQIGPTPTRVGSRYSSSTRVVYMLTKRQKEFISNCIEKNLLLKKHYIINYLVNNIKINLKFDPLYKMLRVPSVKSGRFR